ncbi:MAG TPA: hypothetical protein VFH99_00665 [Candidatus Saccharimonadales bacterium]|nr:hypothetical protein [Candidatus Saccharimonadales bacterium]
MTKFFDIVVYLSVLVLILQLETHVLRGFVAGPDAKERTDGAYHDAGGAEPVAVIERRAQPAAQRAKHGDADKDH